MNVIILIINIVIWAIIIRSLLSWVDPRGENVISRLLFQVTEPLLAPVRNLLGRGMGGLDLSPMIVVIVLYVVEAVLTGSRF